MSIIYLISIVVFFLYAIAKHKNRKRTGFALFLICFYSLLIFLAQYNLTTLGRSFHPSDPEVYFLGVKDLDSIFDVIEKYKTSSNVYYFLINWIFSKDFHDVNLISVLIKSSNAAIFLSLYLISTSSYKFSRIELILMLHPYLLLTTLRNVRDLHVFGLTFMCFSLINRNVGWLKKATPYGLMLISRSFYFLFIVVSELINRISFKLKKIHMYMVIVAILVLFFYSNLFYQAILYPVVAGYGFYNDYGGLYGYFLSNVQSYNRGPEFLTSIGTVIIFAFVRFIFTPIVPNYMEKYFSAETDGVFLNIYTDLDMFLIFFGGIINVVFFIPLFLTRTSLVIKNVKTIDAAYIFSLLNLVIYSLAHLGGTDIRVRFAFLLAFSLSYVFFDKEMILSRNNQYLTIVILLFLPILYQLLKLL
ncbi:hypothetical protein A3712_07060 [Vibrio sp. HI00D65]|uniref:hypothetical protein n=1 Tax=Vibrio sp. HI00D65 TaxID=1822216 RepID=UPI0007B99A86|nr:hypothetical protein [Vibrio sp. HI00D65]KZX55633.1 hypothetical protein A3712_07060 [Vibrio sp. HI00D65]